MRIKERRSGQAGIEWFIVAPLFLTMCLCCFFLWGVSATYTVMNHVASEIAQDVNLRRTGIQSIPNMPSNQINYNWYRTDSSAETRTINVTQNTAKGNFPKYYNATKYYVKKYADEGKFNVPWVKDSQVVLTIWGEEDTLFGHHGDGFLKPGSKIYITINYKAMGLSMSANGLNVVT